MGSSSDLPLPITGDPDLRQAIEAISRRLAELESGREASSGAPASLGFSDEKLATIAMSMYRARRYRTSHFDAELFADPAWDMLLDLFINKVRGVRVSTVSLCLSAHVPSTTALRWIRVLEKQGLLHRHRAPDDHRLKLIELSQEGYRRMRRYISQAATRFEMPAPD